jgi:lysophospholipase L1-like esterase
MALGGHLGKSLPPEQVAPPFDGTRELMGSSLARHVLRHQGYLRVSEQYGFYRLTDHVHLNDRAARLIADEITEYLAGPAASPRGTSL